MHGRSLRLPNTVGCRLSARYIERRTSCRVVYEEDRALFEEDSALFEEYRALFEEYGIFLQECDSLFVDYSTRRST